MEIYWKKALVYLMNLFSLKNYIQTEIHNSRRDPPSLRDENFIKIYLILIKFMTRDREKESGRERGEREIYKGYMSMTSVLYLLYELVKYMYNKGHIQKLNYIYLLM